MVAAWEGSCGRMDQYAMRHTRLMANLCNGGARPEELASALEGAGACRGGALLLA
jgi:legumain